MADVTVANSSAAMSGKTIALQDANAAIYGNWAFYTPIALQGGAPGNQVWTIATAPTGTLGFFAGGGSQFPLQVATNGDLTILGHLIEQGRTVPMGNWTAYVPTLTADAGTWTGATAYAEYAVVGRMCTVQFSIEAGVLSAATTNLYFALPIIATTQMPYFASQANLFLGGKYEIAVATIASGTNANAVQLTRTNAVQFPTGTLYVRGTLTYPI